MENNLPYWIEQKLKERGWSQADFIKEAKKRGHDISDATISRVLNETRQAGNNTLRALADVFNVSPEFVFRLAGELPSGSRDESPTLQELYEIGKNLTPQEQRRLLKVAQLYLEEQQEAYEATPKTSQNRGTAAAKSTS